MTAVVTIFQFRRAVLPYLFMRYCYPAMKEAFPGSLDVWIIQDTGLAKGNIHTSATGRDRSFERRLQSRTSASCFG